jgi:hypothetical protein
VIDTTNHKSYFVTRLLVTGGNPTHIYITFYHHICKYEGQNWSPSPLCSSSAPHTRDPLDFEECTKNGSFLPSESVSYKICKWWVSASRHNAKRTTLQDGSNVLDILTSQTTPYRVASTRMYLGSAIEEKLDRNDCLGKCLSGAQETSQSWDIRFALQRC